MIEINWAAMGIVITLLMSLLALAAWVGAIAEKVKRNVKDINAHKDSNSQEHQRIFDKLDALRELIKNNHNERS